MKAPKRSKPVRPATARKPAPQAAIDAARHIGHAVTMSNILVLAIEAAKKRQGAGTGNPAEDLAAVLQQAKLLQAWLAEARAATVKAASRQAVKLG